MTELRYRSYLADRKNDRSNFFWVSRKLECQIANKQNIRPTPLSHKEAVLNCPKICDLLNKLSREQHIPVEQLRQQVKDILDEIGYNKNLKLIRWLGLVLIKICLKISSGIYANVNGISQVKSVMPKCPVMFVPSHRSYADFILMSCICFEYEIEIPAIAAGMDFHGMWGIGSMLRDTGAFFMRRTYNDDSLYWTTFRQYVYRLVTKGDLPIEFFIEGTRSRSGKSLVPKYGLFAMILKAFFLSEVPDIIFVPISISYDRVMEESLFAFELLGVPKPKESTSGFFKSLKILKEHFGSTYFHFGEPISTKEMLGDKLDRSVHNMRPLYQQGLTEYEKSLMPILAYEIVHKQQKNSVLTAFNLISMILYDNLANKRELLSIETLAAELSSLKLIAEDFGACVLINDAKTCIKDSLQVHENLIELGTNQRISLHWSKVVIDKMNPAKLKAHALSDKTMTYSIPYVMLQTYINPTLHYFVDAALIVIILREKKLLAEDNLFESYHFLRMVLSWEFVIYEPRLRTNFELALSQALKWQIITQDASIYKIGEKQELIDFFCTIFEPFFFAYYVSTVILEDSSNFCDEKTILVNIQKNLERVINDGTQFVSPYCLNLDTLTNCLNSLAIRNVLTKHRRENKVVYEVNKMGISEVKRRLGMCIQPVLRNGENKQPQIANKL